MKIMSSERRRIKPQLSKRRNKPIYVGKKCRDCNKYSSKTFYCAKMRKVLSEDKEACPSFAYRRPIGRKRLRKWVRFTTSK